MVTYAELEPDSNRLAHFLASRGVRAGRPRRRSTAKNSVEHVVAVLAIRQDPRVDHQRELPLRRGRARLPLRQRRRGGADPSSAPTRRWSPRARPSTPKLQTFVVAARRHSSPTTTPTSRRSAACSRRGAGGPERRARLRGAQPRRHPHHLHRRHHRLPQGRDVAPRGLLAGARRRHRLLHRRAAGGVRPVQAGDRAADDDLPAEPADARRRPGRPAHAPVRRAPAPCSSRSSTRSAPGRSSSARRSS